MGERDITSAVKAELAKDNIQLGLFAEMIFDGGPLRLWSGIGDKLLNGNVYSGVGDLGKVDRIEENAGDVRAAGIALSLSGIPSSMIAAVLLENFQGRPINLWLGLFDPGWNLIGNAIKLNGYKLDYPTIDEGGETCTITAFAESILTDLERPRVRRYTDEDQRNLYPNDTGLSQVASLQNKEITWG